MRLQRRRQQQQQERQLAKIEGGRRGRASESGLAITFFPRLASGQLASCAKAQEKEEEGGEREKRFDKRRQVRESLDQQVSQRIASSERYGPASG